VDGLERELQGKASVLRLDVVSRVGGQAAAMYGVGGVPAVVVVDGTGKRAFSQAGLIKSDAVLASVDELLNTAK
jgi:hypothetical protein